jgi:polar amino acid transport system substrate-binding protein
MNKALIGFLSALALVSCAEMQKQTIELLSEEDLAGLRVATVAGSCYDMELSARDDIFLDLYNTDSDLLQTLLNHKADVVVNDEIIINAEVRKESGIKIAMLGKQSFPTAFLFNKENEILANTLSAIQERMVEDGSMQRLKDFWLTNRFTEVDTYPRLVYEATGEPIRVAVTSMTAPLSFMVNGEWYGLEVELLRELGKELNRPLEIKAFGMASGCLAVKTGQADVLSGCIFITPEREKDYKFSEPYHSYHPAYFVLDEDFQRSNEGLIAGARNSFKRNFIQESRWKYITNGLWETLKISVLAILLGSVLGVGLYAMTRSRRRGMRSFARFYNGFMAGIPELVLLLIMFYVVFPKTGLPSDMVAVITFALFFASGASDIYKTSLDAIPNGQTEAGLALGFTRAQTFFHIVLPQAVRRGLPLYKGQCVSLLKGTSIVGYIAIQDLTRAGDIIRSRTFDAIFPLLVVTVIYFLLVWLIGLLLHLAAPKKKVL